MLAEWQVPELGSWQRRLQQGFANQHAKLENARSRIQQASAGLVELEQEGQRLQRKIQIREEELQEAAERVACLRQRHDALASKNQARAQAAAWRVRHEATSTHPAPCAGRVQDVANAHKRLLAERDQGRAEYITRLRDQTAKSLASRRAFIDALNTSTRSAAQVAEEVDGSI